MIVNGFPVLPPVAASLDEAVRIIEGELDRYYKLSLDVLSAVTGYRKSADNKTESYNRIDGVRLRDEAEAKIQGVQDTPMNAKSAGIALIEY